jgi:hypothetical protein
MEHKKSKPSAKQGSPNKAEQFKMTEVMELKIIASRSP